MTDKNKKSNNILESNAISDDKLSKVTGGLESNSRVCINGQWYKTKKVGQELAEKDVTVKIDIK